MSPPSVMNNRCARDEKGILLRQMDMEQSMRHKLIMAALLCLLMLFSCASAQTLPGVDVFSPGLLRVSEKAARGEAVAMDAQMDVNDMLYVRDVSVLSEMLSGTTFSYTGVGSFQKGGDALSISREGEELFAFGIVRDGAKAQVSINGQTYAADLSAYGEEIAQADTAGGLAILERVPLETVCSWIEGLGAGDALIAGLLVTQPFSVERTMSDDGLRLTRIDIAGEIAREGEAPYRVAGYLRQPGGRSPKDTFAITFTQDERNFIELDYSALRTSEITRKNKAGETEVDSTLKAAGKIDGSSFSSRLRVITRNAWTADGESLHERVSINATLGHTDHAPGRRMQRLNDLSVKLRSTLTLDTAEAGDDVIGIDGESTLSAVFDGNTFMDIAVDSSTQVGGSGGAAQGETAMEAAQPASWQALAAALEDAAASLAQRMYPQLGEKTRDKIGAGL